MSRLWTSACAASIAGAVLGFAYFFDLAGGDALAAYLFVLGLIAGAAAMYLVTEDTAGGRRP